MDTEKPDKSFEFGPFRLDPAEQLLMCDGKPVPLPPKAFEMLVALVRQNGHLVIKEELMRAVWPDTFVEEGNLSVNISILRKALGETEGGQQYIETVPRRGYRFVAPIVEAEGDALIVRKRTRARVVIKEEIVDEDDARQLTEQTALSSIAVLPLKSLNADAADEYLSIGMADALITKLANLRRMIVRPTGTVFKYAAAGQNPQAIGRELEVDAVLDGHIQRVGDRLRVTVQLVGARGASEGATLWAEKFDSALTHIFEVQDSISAQVAEALIPQLTGEERRVTAKHYTENAEAYQLYLKGRYYWNKWTEDGMKKAIESFRQAVEKDPAFALAFAGIADCYAFGILPLPPQQAAPLAKEAALKALELDPMLSEARTSLAYVRHAYDWDWAGADEEFARAIELNPNYAHAHHMRSHLFVTMGRIEDSLEASLRACELDPLNAEMSAHLIFHYNAARQYEVAIEQGRKALEIDPNFHETHLFLGRAYEQQGMYEEAIAEFRKAADLSGGRSFAIAGLGHALAVSGRSEEARQIAQELKSRTSQGYAPLYYIGCVYAGLGESEQALHWLEKAYADRDPLLVYLNINPHLNGLREDPRFLDLLRRMNLA